MSEQQAKVNGDQYAYPGTAAESGATLTKREVFAMAALAGMNVSPYDDDGLIARAAVLRADALLQALEAKP